MSLKHGFCFLTSIIAVCLAGDYCYIDGEYEYCDHGCCGGRHDRECCTSSSWIIAVCVVGAIILIVAISVIIFFCWYKSKRNQRQVGSPRTTEVVYTTTPTHIYNTQSPVYPMQAGPNPPPYALIHPPVYSMQSSHQPPPYTASNSQAYYMPTAQDQHSHPPQQPPQYLASNSQPSQNPAYPPQQPAVYH